MDVGDEFEIVQDPKAPKGRRIVRKGKAPAQAVKEEVMADDPALDMTDDEIRDEVESLTGKRPHHKTGRAKLIEQWEAAYNGT